MKNILMLCLIMSITSVAYNQDQTIYQFKVDDINGDKFDFNTLKGKKIIVVNTAGFRIDQHLFVKSGRYSHGNPAVHLSLGQ